MSDTTTDKALELVHAQADEIIRLREQNAAALALLKAERDAARARAGKVGGLAQLSKQRDANYEAHLNACDICDGVLINCTDGSHLLFLRDAAAAMVALVHALLAEHDA